MKETTFHKNEQFEVVFEDLTHEGFGVAKTGSDSASPSSSAIGSSSVISPTSPVL